VNSQQTLETLLKQNREHDQWSGPQRNNHVPMVLIALYRLGGNSDAMVRYAARYNLAEGTTSPEIHGTDAITIDNWREHLGRGRFSEYVSSLTA
jgi:hypothetical protein